MAKKGQSSTLNLFISVAIILVIIAAAIFFLLNGPTTGPGAAPQITPTPEPIGGASLSAPGCTIAISGTKVPPSTIQLQVMTSTCMSGDVSELRVSVNGVQKGLLGSNTGTTGTFPGTTGKDSVIVVVKYANGVENVIYQNMAL